MRRATALVALAVVLLLAMGMGGGVVTADDGGNQTDEANETDEEYVALIDSNTKLTEWSFSDGTFTLEIDAERATRMTVAESGSFEEGSGQFMTRELSIPEGQSTHTVRTAERTEHAALTMATARSMQEERGAYISTGLEPADPFGPLGGGEGLAVGIVLSVVMAFGAAGFVVWREESGVVKA